MKKEYDLKKMKTVKNPVSKLKKKNVGIGFSPAVIDYFKAMSVDTNIPYQRLIDMYLLDCVKHKKKLNLQWTG